MELPDVGKCCHLKDCNSLDFLPVTCPFCQETFCGNHRLPANHNCLQQNQYEVLKCEKCFYLIKTPTGYNSHTTLQEHLESNCILHKVQAKTLSKECGVKGCSNVDVHVGAVTCEGCNKGYCLSHRYPSAHECESELLNKKKKAERKISAQKQVAKNITLSNQPPKPKSAVLTSKGNIGSLVDLMKLKSRAKGDSSIPVASRIYLYAKFPSLSKMESVCVYFDKSKSIGRVLDSLADMSKMINKNNVLSSNDSERLCLYKYPEMVVLENSLSLESVLKNMDTILLEKHSVISL